MGGGKSKNNKNAKNLQDLQDQQKNQSRSEKYEPFAEVEIQRLREKFKAIGEGKTTITIANFKELLEMKTHFFRQRIFQIVEDEMKKRNKSDMDFDFFVKQLTPFHPLTSIETKYKLLFDIYDINGVNILLINTLKMNQNIQTQQDSLISEDDIKSTMKIIYSIQIRKEKQDVASNEPNTRKKNVQVEELKEAFMSNQDYLDSLAKDIMNDFDKDRSGELDFMEFKDLVDNLDLQFRLNINF